MNKEEIQDQLAKTNKGNTQALNNFISEVASGEKKPRTEYDLDMFLSEYVNTHQFQSTGST